MFRLLVNGGLVPKVSPGYNRQSLAIGHTEVEGLSRITTVVPGTDDSISKLVQQLYKLVDMHEVVNVSDHTVTLEVTLQRLLEPYDSITSIGVGGDGVVVFPIGGVAIRYYSGYVLLTLKDDASDSISFERARTLTETNFATTIDDSLDLVVDDNDLLEDMCKLDLRIVGTSVTLREAISNEKMEGDSAPSLRRPSRLVDVSEIDK
ncbi:hypothetical protein V6N13_036764 [Hibiscus sabdariffa]